MTPEQTTLAKRLAAHPRWRWMPGTLAVNDKGGSVRILAWAGAWSDELPGTWCTNGTHCTWLDAEGDDWYPALTDPATQGCLLAMWDEDSGCDDPGADWSMSLLAQWGPTDE